MGGVEDVAAGRRVCSRHHGDDVGRVIVPHLADDVRLETDGQLHCLESALAGGFDHLIGVHARRGEELSGNVELYPTGRLEHGKRIVPQIGGLGRFGIADYLPPVAGEVGAVNDQHPRRAPARRFFELVGPTAVIGESLALKEMLVVRGRLVDDGQQDFPFDVDALVIIPLILRRIDPVTHEDDGSVQVDARRTGLVLGHVVFAILQRGWVRHWREQR